jgi:hypothetical protein
VLLKGTTGATPQTPKATKDSSSSRPKSKDNTPEIPPRKSSQAEKQKAPQLDLVDKKKRKAHNISGVSISEPSGKKSHKEKDTTIVVAPAVATPTSSGPAAVAAASLPPLSLSGPLPQSSNELGEEFQKHLQAVISETDKGKGVVWRTQLLKEHPDSLGVYFPGYNNMQHNLAPSAAERIEYEREAFRLTSTAEERKLVEEDPLGAIGLMLHYQHHSGVITGALWDKYKEEHLRLEATPPGIPESTATVIERDFYKNQMLSSNRLANLRLEEIHLGKREAENAKNALQRQHASLKQKEAELAEALAKVAGMEKELVERDRQLEETQAALKTQKEELPRKAVEKFLGSQAFTVASQISCDGLISATIYDELRRLSDVYPFSPKHCGYIEIEESLRTARALPGWTWDEKKDRLMNKKGSKVKPPESFLTASPVAIPIPWKGHFRWPFDVNDPAAGWMPEEDDDDEEEDEEEEEEEIGEEQEGEHNQESEGNPPNLPTSPVPKENPTSGETGSAPIVQETAATSGPEVLTSGQESAFKAAEDTSPHHSSDIQID